MKYLLIICFLYQSFTLSAQSWVGFGIGGNVQQLRFQNSEGGVDDDLKGQPGIIASLFYQYELAGKRPYKRQAATNFINLNMSYRSGKIVDRTSHVVSTWTMHYLSSGLTIRRKSNSKHRVNPYYGAGLVTEVLLNGLQNRGFEQYDLTEEIKALNLGLKAETGLAYHLSNDAYGTFQLAYVRGLSNLERDTQQKARLHHWKLSIAVFLGFDQRNRKRR